MAKTKSPDLSERDQQVVKTLEHVLYQTMEEDCDEPYGSVYTDLDDLAERDGELIGVYTLSHFARVKTRPVKATLTVVAVK